jgi:hypothetical protein
VRKKLLIPPLVIILLVIASVILGGLHNQSPTQTSTSSISSGGCPELLPAPNTASNVQQIHGSVGVPLKLDAAALFSVNESKPHSYLWTQLFANRTELDYVTSFAASMTNVTERTVTVNFSSPGNYRFQLSVTDPASQAATAGTHRIDVLVTQDGVRKLNAKGVIFSDVFEDLGGKNFILGPHPEPCQTQLFDSAMAGPSRIGAGWVGFVPAIFYLKVSPTPKFDNGNNDLSLSNNTYYYELMASAKAHGFKIVETVQASVGPNTPANESSLLPRMENSSVWWDAWFTQWKAVLLSEGVRAQKAGVDMLTICLYCDDTFRPNAYPNYTQRWQDIISSVRQVYKGQVAMSLIVADNRFTMYKDLDAVFVTIFPDLYTSSHPFADPNNPTVQEITNTTARLFSYFDWMQGKIPVYIIFLAYSSVGQFHGDPPPWGNNPPPANLTDFREQAKYYEVILNFLQNKPWVSGFFSERWDYFDHFVRPPTAPNSFYFDQTLGNSPRSKPAEAVIKLWFTMY